MRQRTFTSSFVDRQIAAVDALHAANREQTHVLPAPNPDCHYDGRLYQQCRAVAKQRYQIGYVDGFWMGWTLRHHAAETTEDEVTA